jgi:error-prone DNA polymerase
MVSYIELRARSAFSFLAGASLPEELIERAAALGYPALAVGDRDGVYGAPRLHQAAKKAGLRAIVGCALTLADGGALYVLVAERAGYRNLCRLLTDVKLRAAKGAGRAEWSDLDGHTDGLWCLAGGTDGPLAAALGRGDVDATIARLQRLFPGRLAIDLQRHLEPAEERFNRTCMAIAARHRVPLAVTNDVRHAIADERPLLDVLMCLREKMTLDAAGRRLLANAERHLKPAAEMAALFRDCPRALATSAAIAEQCAFTLADLGYRFPDYPLPAGETPIGHLRALTYAGARERYRRITPRVRAQLEHELAVIGQLDLAGYFLIVWDIVRYCREARVLAQGRGSAANSAVCYALGITAVDPIAMDLLFERFLSPERGEWPDIDIDLPSGDQREQVIQYVYRRYGARGAAMTANVITYRTRSAVREVGKVLGFAEAQVDRLSKLLQRFEFRDDQDELAAQLKAGGVDPAAPRVRRLVDLVGQMQSLPRHLGQHSGGMVIAAGRLDEVVPLEPAAMPGRVVVQWDKDDCADLGIIKVDLLGLGMMAVLEDAIPLVRAHEGIALDLAHLPPDDPQTYAMLQRADTIGVFQVESRAQMATLPRMRPERFYDLVVEVAIIRPGPIVGQLVHPYLARRRGREPVTYAHPDLEPILARTLGVPLFQEQLLRIAMVLAGFTGGEAEELRRAMGFKRSVARMREIESRLRAGMAARGITGATAERIIQSITSFALYGFPESHAASFALLAYASAYLRAHHLAAFTCAMLNNWPLGFYHPATLVKDAQRHGLRVLPIDVTRSGWKCHIEAVLPLCGYAVTESGAPLTANRLTANRLALRLGLRYAAGLREAAGKRIEAARAEAPFTSITDVALRADLRADEVQTLAHLGAFAAFGLTRRAALWQAAAVPERGSLFGEGVTRLRGHAVRKRTENMLDRQNNAAASISGTARTAPSDGIGGTLLPSDTCVSGGRAIRADDAGAPRGGVDRGEHRGGKRAQDATRLRKFSSNQPGKPARAGNVPVARNADWSGPGGSDQIDTGSSRISRAPIEPPDRLSRIDPAGSPQRRVTANRPGEVVRRLRGDAVTASEPSPTANCLTASRLTPATNPLPEMTALDRTLADYQSTGMTVGPHLMTYVRAALDAEGVVRAIDLPRQRNGSWVKTAGLVIVRQRPGTAKGFCFLTLEDETGIGNAVVTPDLFQRHRSVIHTASLLLVEGPIQSIDDVIHVRARRFRVLDLPRQPITQTGSGYRMRVSVAPERPVLPKSHDFR